MGPSAFGWEPHPEVWLLAGGLLVAYAAVLRSRTPGAPATRAVSRSQLWAFAAGVLVLWLTLDWPLHALASEMLAAHMVQHLLLAFVAVPLLLLGLPGWLLRGMLSPAPLRAAWRWLTRPLTALLLFNSALIALHWPALVNTAATHHLLHTGTHLALVAVAFVLWWPVLSPLPEMPPLEYPWAIAYLFAQSTLPAVPASVLTYGGEAWFDAYALTAPLWGLDPLLDQQIAGLVFKIGGVLLLWGVILALFLRWHYEEENGAPDIRYWRDVAPELPQGARHPRRADPPPEP
ncbi:cytochrome c oxidase assembly protein [Egibacter rhizosphaerae]|uniref:Cytochrome c oxidase assembly protein n=1 Tax=Egibacter rhizosphaerae TaxID=1670831 RepID=A0A411YAT7_9ACTN|nr:cytochrome c oxidase assembly protein [Egibacter rhizosphaerae]QBI18292.1 cytochrome c oxidase assembly protein [Egibacter rhizosphaerae]